MRDGIYFAGLDVVGDKIIEINVQSPGGITRINALNRTSLQKNVINFIEEVINTKDSYTRDSDDDIVENEDERKADIVEMEKSNDGSVWMNVSDIKFIESVWFPNRFKLLDKNRFQATLINHILYKITEILHEY